MKYTEIKEKMTEGIWKVMVGDGSYWVSLFEKYRFARLVNHANAKGDPRANAHAIVTAVNNTYGKGIDPEAIPIMKIALEEWKRQIEKVINWGNAFLGEKFDEKMQRNLLRQCEQALAAAERKGMNNASGQTYAKNT